jgi:ankyrin repeat protein
MLSRPAHIGTQSGRTALIRAANGGHTDCARLLLEGGANVDAKSNVRGKSFLIFTCIYLFIECFRPFSRWIIYLSQVEFFGIS